MYMNERENRTIYAGCAHVSNPFQAPPAPLYCAVSGARHQHQQLVPLPHVGSVLPARVLLPNVGHLKGGVLQIVLKRLRSGSIITVRDVRTSYEVQARVA